MLTSRKKQSQRLTTFAGFVVKRAGIVDPQVERTVFDAVASVQRHLFVPSQFQGRAYEDVSLPIGFNQTSSQPSLVARMLGLICLHPGMRILEVGTGSGYTAALMAAAGAQVYGLESVGLLAQQTRKRLDSLGYSNVLIRRRTGMVGWHEHAPFDAVLLSTALPEVPEALLSQLQQGGGLLIAPIGGEQTQQLCLVERAQEGYSWYQLEGCRIS